MPAVHLWLIDPATVPPSSWECLDRDDRRLIAAQKHLEAARARAASYVLLRRALSALDGGDLNRWRLRRQSGRRPVVEGSHRHVSLSRTTGLVGVAIASRPVGLDVERIISVTDLDEVVVHLDLDHQDAVSANTAPQVRCTELWTDVEAVLKAEGIGIIDGPRVPPSVAAKWHVRHVDVGKHHRCAVATGDPRALLEVTYVLP